MSKTDSMRAMREAKYAAARAAQGSSSPRAAQRPGPVAPEATPAATRETPASGADELCGHRNMSGRTCTREAGHAAKSHRYS